MSTIVAIDQTHAAPQTKTSVGSDTIPLVRDLREISRADVKLVGGKAANLGEMRNAGLPVPQGFVVTTESYRVFLEANRLAGEIVDRLRKLDVDDGAQL